MTNTEETRRRMRARRGARVGASMGVALAAVLAGGTAVAHAVDPDAYLQDYTAAAGQIQPDSGNRSGYSAEICGFEWSAQAVIDNDLQQPYSRNGFLEDVNSLGTPGLPGSGWAQIQHWYDLNVPGGQLNWRIPIAISAPLQTSRVEMVFDDPDWTPDRTSFHQYSTWPSQPEYEGSFHRFSGIAGYAPHDDTQVTPFEWGTDVDGHTTLAFDLGNIEAGTSTVLQFSGVPVGGADAVRNGTAFGAKFTLNGLQPVTTCLTPSYPEQSVLTGATATADPSVVETATDASTAFPTGTVFSLGAGSPAGATIDAATGRITWPVPGGHPVGTTTIPVIVTYPDDAQFTDGSVDRIDAAVHVGKEARLGPFGDQSILLGDAIETVTATLRDHLGAAYGDGSTLRVEGLPAGVTFDPATGEIGGVPAAVGAYPVTVSGLNSAGDELVSAAFTITVAEAAKPAPTSPSGPPAATADPAPEPAGKTGLAATGAPSLAVSLLLGTAALGAGALLFAQRRRAHRAIEPIE